MWNANIVHKILTGKLAFEVAVFILFFATFATSA